MGNVPRRHHIVPQCYLKYFTDENGKLEVFDKARNCKYCSTPKDVAVRRDFYRDYLSGNEFVWEEFYSSNVESIIPGTFDYIINISNKENLLKRILTDEIKDKLSLIIIMQLFRTITWRQHSYRSFDPKSAMLFNNVGKLRLMKNRCGESFLSEIGMEALSKNQDLELSNHEITLYTHSQILLERIWVLIRNEEDKTRIVTSDNPVMLYNESSSSFALTNNYITDNNNFVFFPISRKLFLIILPLNNIQVNDFRNYADCMIAGAKGLINFHNQGQFIQASRQIFI